MQQKRRSARRPAGTGCLFVRRDAAGRDTWYGKVGVRGRQVKRRLGRKGVPGTSEGLTRRQAEAALRQLIREVELQPPAVERADLEQAGRRYIDHVEVLGRKASTVSDYRSILRLHLGP